MTTTATHGVYENITDCIGNTPLVRLQRVATECVADVVAKVENMNPLWSVKDRIGRAMIEAAERDGLIGDNTVIVLPNASVGGTLRAFPPVLIEVEGRTVKLEGSAETQFGEWRRLLREIFAAETGFPLDPDTGQVTQEPATSG